MSGDKSPVWKGGYDPYYGPNWDETAERARIRDGRRCRRCHKHEHELGRKLHVHHIVRLSAFKRDFDRANDLSNLISLCSACHKKVEWCPDEIKKILASEKEMAAVA
jgi:5-methylcytosine-specific restriction endonuclease McrA